MRPTYGGGGGGTGPAPPALDTRGKTRVLPKILTDKVGKGVMWTKFLLHQTNQNGLSHVIRPQEVYLLVPTLWLNSVKLKGVSSRFYNKTYKDK